MNRGRKLPRRFSQGDLRQDAPLSLRLDVLHEARHDFDEVAGAMPEIELKAQDQSPGILAGARRARHAENIGATSDPAKARD